MEVVSMVLRNTLISVESEELSQVGARSGVYT